MFVLFPFMRRLLKKIGFIIILLNLLASSMPASLVSAAPAQGLPPAPVYLTPANGSTITPTQDLNSGKSERAMPVFSWKPVTNAVTYGFELNTSSNFSGVPLLRYVVPNTTFIPTTINIPDMTLYWRVWVQADINGVKGDETASPTWSFTKRWDIEWNKPTLILPQNGAT